MAVGLWWVGCDGWAAVSVSHWMGAGDLTLVISLPEGHTSSGPGLCSGTKVFRGKQLATLRRVQAAHQNDSTVRSRSTSQSLRSKNNITSY